MLDFVGYIADDGTQKLMFLRHTKYIVKNL